MFSVIVEQLLAMLSYDSKVLVARFDLHQDVATNSSKHVSECIKQLKKQLFASHSLKFVGYAWCREEGDGVRQHYHLALFLEGHKMKTTYKLEEALCAIWKSVGGTHMHRARFHNIHRDDPEAIAEALFHLSYLAKCKGKATISPNFKAFSASRLTIKASLS